MQLCTAKKSEREKQNISFSVSKYINIHKFHWNWFYTLVALSYRIAHYLTSSHIPFFFIVAQPRFFSQQNLQKCSRLDETGQVCVYACVRRPLQNEHGCMRALRLIFTSTMWPRWLCPRRLCWCRMGTADLRGFSHTHTQEQETKINDPSSAGGNTLFAREEVSQRRTSRLVRISTQISAPYNRGE